MGVALTDFTLVFGVNANGGSGTSIVIDKAIIHVAPGMLKQMLRHLSMAVSAYEEVMGEIKLPARLDQNLAKIKMRIVTTLSEQMNDQ